MSGLVGSITDASRTFNDIELNNTIKGIKTANYLNGKIQAAELDAKNKPEKEKEEEQINPENLAKEIQDDMTR